MFSNAEAIIAPHGAGLTNMIYSPSGINVAEILFSPALHYIIMAKQLGHCFYRLQAIPTGDRQFDDMNLDAEKLENWLKFHFYN